MSRLQFGKTLAVKMRLKARWLRAVEAKRDPGVDLRPFILTGPPRSGTSLTAALLTRKPNVLVANEPVVVGDPLLALGEPAELLRGYVHTVARQALTKGTLTTKADPEETSKATTDTANKGAVRLEVPVNIDRSKPLCVAVKHTIPFMEFFEELVAGWPELKVIVLVREPGPTIRSWRETSYGWQPGLDGPKEGLQRRMYKLVPRSDSPLERRAHLWKLLVERAEKQAREHPDQVLLQRYEQLRDDPRRILAKMFRHIGAPDPDAPVDVGDVKPQVHASYKGFTPEEAAVIERVCGEADRRTRPEMRTRA